jgi:hypothetical protein
MSPRRLKNAANQFRRAATLPMIGGGLVVVVAVSAQAPAQNASTAGTKVMTLAIPPTHVVLAREPGRYGGWPANHGIWSWGNEILVGFSWGHMTGGTAERGHPIDRQRPEEHMLARSLDGGETWKLEKPAGLVPPPTPGNIAGVPTDKGGKEAVALTTPIDFTAPGFALTARMSDIHTGPSWFFYTADKGHTWDGPFKLPDFGHKGIAARTDYLVEGRNELTIFLTAAKSNGREGRVLCARTKDGGRTWSQVGMVGPEPAGNDFAIMPSSVRLSPASILTLVRHRQWIEAYRSDDNGATWTHVIRAVPDTGRGNPPSLVKLRDGRLVGRVDTARSRSASVRASAAIKARPGATTSSCGPAPRTGISGIPAVFNVRTARSSLSTTSTTRPPPSATSGRRSGRRGGFRSSRVQEPRVLSTFNI